MRKIGIITLAVAAALVVTGLVAYPLVNGEPTAAAIQPNPVKQPAAPAAPTLPEAQKVMQESVDSYAAGDYASAWALWVPEAKKLFSLENYLRLHTECPGITGIKFEIKSGRLDNPTTATFRIERAGFLFTYQARYVDGAWWFQPEKDDMADYRKGVSYLIKKRCPSA